MLLRLSPAASRRKWALRLLSLSPHYFIEGDQEAGAGLTLDERLELATARWAESRSRLSERLVQPHLRPDSVVLDYGCGPGFLTKAVAAAAGRTFGCDISRGALACARILNGGAGIEYLEAHATGLRAIPDGGVDVVASFALAQHVTDRELAEILAHCHRKLRRGGRLLLHFHDLGEGWRSEEQWRGDRSLRGRARYRFGLHCFGRDDASVETLASRCGFTHGKCVPIRDWVDGDFDDICRQHLFCAERS